jgi:hypothetical protein
MIIMLAAVGVQAQDGTTPYVGSTHNYKITRGMTQSVLAWGVPTGTVGGIGVTPALGTHYNIIAGGGDSNSIDIQWVLSGTYVIQFSETRTVASGYAGCPTTRELTVVVGSNSFDVYADLITTDEACATIDPNVVVDVANDGSNTNDVFGETEREFLVTAVDATGDWNFTYTLTHKNGGVDEAIGDFAVKIGATDISTTGQTVNVTGTSTQTITVTYTTNSNRQDKDFDLVLTITDASDSLSTPDSNSTGGKTNDATYIVRALPATTGITTD